MVFTCLRLEKIPKSNKRSQSNETRSVLAPPFHMRTIDSKIKKTNDCFEKTLLVTLATICLANLISIKVNRKSFHFLYNSKVKYVIVNRKMVIIVTV